MIKVGDQLPQAEFSLLTESGMEKPTSQSLFTDKTVVLFAVPGAFTPTCSAAHLPGYVTLADKFKEKGVDTLICLSVNDAFVMKAWGDAHNASEIVMLADGDGAFTKTIGLGKNTASFGGYRSTRYAMVIKNGVVSHLNVEAPKEFEVSKAEVLLALL